MSIKNFWELEVWKRGHELTLQVYLETKKFPSDEKFGMISQMRRASSSVTANIAEGFARFHYKDKIKFYHQARASLAEVQNFLFLAKDLQYMDADVGRSMFRESQSVAKLINGLIRANKR